MKRTLLALVVAFIPLLAFAEAPSVTIKQEARKCAKAFVDADFERVVFYTHKRVIDLMGGKKAAVATIKRGMDEMRSQGITCEDATIGEPDKPQKVDSWLVAFIPQRMLMKVPGGHLEQDAHLLGISEDEGKTWVFMDVGPITKTQFTQLFPELAKKIELPEKKEFVFKKDAKE